MLIIPTACEPRFFTLCDLEEMINNRWINFVDNTNPGISNILYLQVSLAIHPINIPPFGLANGLMLMWPGSLEIYVYLYRYI